jgi:phage portal protein BeeE
LTDEAIQAAQQKAFVNGILPSMALIVGRHPDLSGVAGQRPILTKDQREQLLAAVHQRLQGAERAGNTMILDGVIEDIKKISNSPNEMDFTKSGEMVKQRIFQAFGVNPIIAGEVQHANRAQAAVADESFCDNCVNPKIELISQWMTMELPARFDDPDCIVFIEPARAKDPDRTRLETDLMAKYGAITKNELRATFSLPPLPNGLGGDELIKPAQGSSADNGGGRADPAGGAAFHAMQKDLEAFRRWAAAITLADAAIGE